jgi:hypothetical protein
MVNVGNDGDISEVHRGLNMRAGQTARASCGRDSSWTAAQWPECVQAAMSEFLNGETLAGNGRRQNIERAGDCRQGGICMMTTRFDAASGTSAGSEADQRLARSGFDRRVVLKMTRSRPIEVWLTFVYPKKIYLSITGEASSTGMSSAQALWNQEQQACGPAARMIPMCALCASVWPVPRWGRAGELAVAAFEFAKRGSPAKPSLGENRKVTGLLLLLSTNFGVRESVRQVPERRGHHTRTGLMVS